MEEENTQVEMKAGDRKDVVKAVEGYKKLMEKDGGFHIRRDAGITLTLKYPQTLSAGETDKVEINPLSQGKLMEVAEEREKIRKEYGETQFAAQKVEYFYALKMTELPKQDLAKIHAYDYDRIQLGIYYFLHNRPHLSL